jgi:hypothetical protein
MTSAGTLISDLDSKMPGNDDDLVRQIMADVNGGGSNNMMMPPQAPPPPMGGGMPPPQVNSYRVQQPNANAIYSNSADPAVPTAHMIGRDHPNPSDFASMMMANGQGGSPYMSQQQQNYPVPMPQATAQPQGAGWQGKLFDQLRQPILVALIVFVLSLPAVNVLFSYYAPSLLRSGGDLNNLGLLARASIAGLTFWIFQNVIAPLMTSY